MVVKSVPEGTLPGLGDLVRDKISGLKGIVVCRSEWLYNCVRIVVEPTALTKDGAKLEPHACDEDQVEVLEVQKLKPPAIVKQYMSTGGDETMDLARQDEKVRSSHAKAA